MLEDFLCIPVFHTELHFADLLKGTNANSIW
jgi:hypothetical protein